MQPEDGKPEAGNAGQTSGQSEPQSGPAQPEAAVPVSQSAAPEPKTEEVAAQAAAKESPAPAAAPAIVRLPERRLAQLSRRELLKVAPVLALGAFAIPALQAPLLKRGLAFSDWMSARLFRRSHLAPTFGDSELTPFEKFPINDYDVDDPGVIFENWTLTVGGSVANPGDYTLAQVQALPRYRHNTRHICVEGWDVIGRFGGARLSDFLAMIGADTSARYITVACADDYYESLDMATALHPQTLLCYEMYDRPLTREHGAPLRLNIPTKIGYKQAKYLTDLKVTSVLTHVGYWEDQGYSEFYGL